MCPGFHYLGLRLLQLGGKDASSSPVGAQTLEDVTDRAAYCRHAVDGWHCPNPDRTVPAASPLGTPALQPQSPQ